MNTFKDKEWGDRREIPTHLLAYFTNHRQMAHAASPLPSKFSLLALCMPVYQLIMMQVFGFILL